MTFPNAEVTIDVESINRRIYAHARGQAIQDATNDVMPNLFKVEVGATTGYTVADALDYDTEQEQRNGKVRILISDVQTVKQDIAEAKPLANAITKRALNTFSRAIDARVRDLGANRLEKIAQSWTSLLSPSGTGRFEDMSILDLTTAYNLFLQSPDICLEFSGGRRSSCVDVHFSARRNYRLATITSFFDSVGDEIRTLFAIDFLLQGIFSHVRRALFTASSSSGVSVENNPYVVSNGLYVRNPITSLDEAVEVVKNIFDLVSVNGRERIANELTNRLNKLSTVCGPLTASFSDGSHQVFSVTESSVA